MTQEHPITPPPELLKHWEDQHFDESENYDVMLIQLPPPSLPGRSRSGTGGVL
jgi:hypothetical protein